MNPCYVGVAVGKGGHIEHFDILSSHSLQSARRWVLPTPTLARTDGERYPPRMPVTAASPSLEERVARLEEALGRLLAAAREPHPDGWRGTVGMFGEEDEGMKQVDEAGRRWREAENRRPL